MVETFRDMDTFRMRASQVPENIVYHHWECPICKVVAALGAEEEELRGNLQLLSSINDILIKDLEAHYRLHSLDIEVNVAKAQERNTDILNNIKATLEDLAGALEENTGGII